MKAWDTNSVISRSHNPDLAMLVWSGVRWSSLSGWTEVYGTHLLSGKESHGVRRVEPASPLTKLQLIHYVNKPKTPRSLPQVIEPLPVPRAKLQSVVCGNYSSHVRIRWVPSSCPSSCLCTSLPFSVPHFLFLQSHAFSVPHLPFPVYKYYQSIEGSRNLFWFRGLPNSLFLVQGHCSI